MSTTVLADQEEIQNRLIAIEDRIRTACEKSGRDPRDVQLIAITKTFPTELVRKACALGFAQIGENRIQESIEKYKDNWIRQEFPGTRLHLVGHLQSNKVRKAFEIFDSIDSVDSLSLAERISRIAEETGRSVRTLLEVNSSGEARKFGLEPAAVLDVARQATELPNTTLSGLMTVGPLTDDQTRIRSAFRMMHDLFKEINCQLRSPHWTALSMGMTGDFEIAIEEGATEIRLGSALFGPRS